MKIEQAKQSMQSVLTDEEKEVLTKNLPEIKQYIRKLFVKNRNLHYLSDSRSVVDSILSYAPNVIKSYNPSKNYNFVKYVAIMSVYRFIDSYRKINRRLKNKVKIKSLSELSNEDLSKQFYMDGQIQEIEWLDFKDYILNNIDKFFQQNIYKVLIREYLLPKCENQNWRSLRSISKQFNVTKQAVFNTLKDDNMRGFFNRIYAEKI